MIEFLTNSSECAALCAALGLTCCREEAEASIAVLERDRRNASIDAARAELEKSRPVRKDPRYYRQHPYLLGIVEQLSLFE